MAGYHNFSMSNNAVTAYSYGEKPLSKWTKGDILKELQDLGATDEHMNIFRKMRLADLKESVLFKSSWHHTSSYYNQTDFYSVEYDEEKIYRLPEAEKKPDLSEKLVHAHFLEWSGTRNHPKCSEHSRWGVIKGNSFYYVSCNDIKTKRITANGFYVLEESDVKFNKEQLSDVLRKDYRTGLTKKDKLTTTEIIGMSLFYADSMYKGNDIVPELIKTGFKNKHVVLLSKSINKYIVKEFPTIDMDQLVSANLNNMRTKMLDKQKVKQHSIT